MREGLKVEWMIASWAVRKNHRKIAGFRKGSPRLRASDPAEMQSEENYQKFENMMDMNEDIKMKFAEVPNAVKRTYTFRQ